MNSIEEVVAAPKKKEKEIPKKIALITVHGDPLGIVTEMLEFARDRYLPTKEVIVLHLDLSGSVSYCLVSVQGDLDGHVTKKLNEMISKKVLPQYVRIVRVSVPDERLVKVEPFIPGFSPSVSWSGLVLI